MPFGYLQNSRAHISVNVVLGSMTSTLLNEQGWNRNAIERQLAHAERNSVRAAYNYAEFMPERKKMMQAWADYLDAIKAGAKIIPMRSAAG